VATRKIRNILRSIIGTVDLFQLKSDHTSMPRLPQAEHMNRGSHTIEIASLGGLSFVPFLPGERIEKFFECTFTGVLRCCLGLISAAAYDHPHRAAMAP
jgi:hypothetical protein